MRTLKFDEILAFFSLEVETRFGEHVLRMLETEPFHVLCVRMDDREGRADLDESCASFPGFGMATTLNF